MVSVCILVASSISVSSRMVVRLGPLSLAAEWCSVLSVVHFSMGFAEFRKFFQREVQCQWHSIGTAIQKREKEHGRYAGESGHRRRESGGIER